MTGKAAGEDETGIGRAERRPGCRVEVRGLLIIAAIGVVGIAGAIAVTSYRTAVMRAEPAATSTAIP
jgi:hypothetical protein